MYCVYLIIYSGTELPPFYIGSTSITKLDHGYFGSVSSKKYKEIFQSELKKNIHLFDSIILEEFKDRKNALIYELKVQKQKDVVKSNQYMNMAFACPNGFFGMVVTGKDHPRYGITGKNHPMYGSKRFGSEGPMYGKKHTQESKNKISEALYKKVILTRENKKIQYKSIKHLAQSNNIPYSSCRGIYRFSKLCNKYFSTKYQIRIDGVQT